jgi:hypothetical protein
MSYTSRTTEHRNARHIAGSAIDSSRRRLRLKRCRALLRELDPEKPPAAVHAREFRWQYRALRERVHLYSERLEAAKDPEGASDYGLLKTEMAVKSSLRYFCEVLEPKRRFEDDDGSESDA